MSDPQTKKLLFQIAASMSDQDIFNVWPCLGPLRAEGQDGRRTIKKASSLSPSPLPHGGNEDRGIVAAGADQVISLPLTTLPQGSLPFKVPRWQAALDQSLMNQSFGCCSHHSSNR